MQKRNNEKLTEADVQKLLKEANLDLLNIFHDRNAIISRLCRALLESWGKDPDQS